MSILETIFYKGYRIQVKPYQLTNSKRWAIEFQIFSPNGKTVLAKMFSGVNTYESKKEAHLHCLHLGKQIIDSKPEI